MPNDWEQINSLGELLECTFATTVAEEVGLANLPVNTWAKIIRFLENQHDHIDAMCFTLHLILIWGNISILVRLRLGSFVSMQHMMRCGVTM